MATEVHGPQELWQALVRKDDEILVLGDYCGKILHKTAGDGASFHGLTAGQILSTGFYVPLFAGLVESMIHAVTGAPKEEAQLERKLKLYQAVYRREDEILLRLKQLDY